MNLFIPRIHLVAVLATLSLTPVFTTAPEAKALPATNSAKIIWQIGKEDQGYSDFALADNNKDYHLKFPPQTILYEIGNSHPAT